MAQVRLNKLLSQTGIASRRLADDLIRQGRVTLNGQVVTELGTKANLAASPAAITAAHAHAVDLIGRSPSPPRRRMAAPAHRAHCRAAPLQVQARPWEQPQRPAGRIGNGRPLPSALMEEALSTFAEVIRAYGRNGRPVVFVNVPDNVRGAYVFRRGFPRSAAAGRAGPARSILRFQRPVGLYRDRRDEGGACHSRWAGQLERPSRRRHADWVGAPAGPRASL